MKTCPKCGAVLTQVDSERYRCENCNTQYKWVAKQQATNETSTMENVSSSYFVDNATQQTKRVSDTRRSAREAISGHYGFAILTSILLNLVKYGSILFTAVFGPFLIGGMTKCSFAGFYLDVANGRQTDISSTFRGFRYMKKSIVAQLLLLLFNALVLGTIIALLVIIRLLGNMWVTLIFSIILFIILVLALIWTTSIDKIVYCLMIDREELTAKQCFVKAFKMVSKNLNRFLALNLSFLGWAVLIVLTLGILILYVDPYYQTAYAKMYMQLKTTSGLDR